MPEAVELVTDLIVQGPVCVSCVVAKSGLPSDQVYAALARIQSVLEVDIHQENRCRSCGTGGTVICVFQGYRRPLGRISSADVPGRRAASG